MNISTIGFLPAVREAAFEGSRKKVFWCSDKKFQNKCTVLTQTVGEGVSLAARVTGGEIPANT